MIKDRYVNIYCVCLSVCMHVCVHQKRDSSAIRDLSELSMIVTTCVTHHS